MKPAARPTSADDVLVLGVGNPLMGDDGVGIKVVEMLKEMDLPENVTVEEAGLPGWGLASWFENRSEVLIVDAVKMGLAPGSWRCLDPHEFQVIMEESSLSLHQGDLACGLALSQALDMLPPKLRIYGIEPASLDPGAGLSPEVSASLEAFVTKISEDIEKKTA